MEGMPKPAGMKFEYSLPDSFRVIVFSRMRGNSNAAAMNGRELRSKIRADASWYQEAIIHQSDLASQRVLKNHDEKGTVLNLLFTE